MSATKSPTRITLLAASLTVTLLPACNGWRPQTDKAVELQHVVKQPGFISRESAAGENGEWLVVVHWRSVEDAEASMASFSSAPAAAQFMSKLDTNTMSMKRYMGK